MAKDYPRSYRVADQLQQELSLVLRDELKDPRVSKMLTISSVEVSRDLSVAKVYYTLMNDSEREDTQTALTSGVGFLRKRLGQRMKLRAIPQLQFRYDNSIEEGARMSALINAAVASNTTKAETDSADESSTDDSVAQSDIPPDGGTP